MVMTMKDKIKCAALYETFTGERTEPIRWNEDAGNLLAEMIHKIKKCSHGMGMARAVWPSAHKITWLWAVKIPLHILKNEIKLRSGQVNLACLNAGVDAYATSIKYELVK
jgi:hypothetical protein